MGMSSEHYALATLPLGKRHVTHCTGGWVGPRAILDGVENLAPNRIRTPDCPAHSELLTDYAIPVHRVFDN